MVRHYIIYIKIYIHVQLQEIKVWLCVVLQVVHCSLLCFGPDTAFVLCSRHRHQDKMTSNKVDAKVVLLGKSFAGKTCLVERYLKNRFMGDTVPYQNV